MSGRGAAREDEEEGQGLPLVALDARPRHKVWRWLGELAPCGCCAVGPGQSVTGRGGTPSGRRAAAARGSHPDAPSPGPGAQIGGTDP